NLATADSNETPPDTDTATVPLVFAPSLNVTKSVSSITDGSDFGASGPADSVADVIHYNITVQNTGNVTLTGLTVTDNVEAQGATNATAVLNGAGHNTGDTNSNDAFDPGETWNFTAAYPLTPAALHGKGSAAKHSVT